MMMELQDCHGGNQFMHNCSLFGTCLDSPASLLPSAVQSLNTSEACPSHLSRQQPGKCCERLALPSLLELPEEKAFVHALARKVIPMR